MRNKFVGILAVLLLAIGFLILNYPTLSTLYNQLHQGTVLTTYDDTVQKMNEEKKKEYWQEAKAYNERLAGTTPQPVSYTHLDVYKRQLYWYCARQLSDNRGSVSKRIYIISEPDRSNLAIYGIKY